MKVINKQLKELIPYENNPRRNDDAVEFVANSIKEFGWKVPLVIDKGNVIVAGHTRYKAAQKLGIEEVPCIVADDLTDEQIKAFRVADNKVGEIASWDNKKLDEELTEIFDIDMSQFGFKDYSDVVDLSENLIEKLEVIIITCPDETNMQETYERLTEEGYECRLSTL